MRGSIPDQETALFFDGGSRNNGTEWAVAGSGAVWYVNGALVWQLTKVMPSGSTNNQAEYEALYMGLQRLTLEETLPSTVVNQVLNRCATNERLEPYRARIEECIETLARERGVRVNLQHVLREGNKDADALSNLAMNACERQLQHRYSATAKAQALRKAVERLTKINGAPIHPAREIMVNSLTGLGGEPAWGLHKRPTLGRKAAMEHVMRQFERRARARQVHKLGRQETARSNNKKGGTLTGGFCPHIWYPPDVRLNGLHPPAEPGELDREDNDGEQSRETSRGEPPVVE